MEIKYERSGYKVITECPHGMWSGTQKNNFIIKVATRLCTKCLYFVVDDEDKETIVCKKEV
jgi:hypothetical protein